MRKDTVVYAYSHDGTVTILPKCKSMRALLIQCPHLATPGHWDEKRGQFEPLALRSPVAPPAKME